MDAMIFENLSKAMEYEEVIVKSLLLISREKTELLIKNSPQELSVVAAREQALLNQLDQLEKVRMQLSDKAAGHLGISDSNPSLADICSAMGKNKGTELAILRDRLRVAMEELRLQNLMNLELIKQSIDYINFSLLLMTKPTAAIPRYGRGGSDLSDKVPSRSLMDLRS